MASSCEFYHGECFWSSLSRLSAWLTLAVSVKGAARRLGGSLPCRRPGRDIACPGRAADTCALTSDTCLSKWSDHWGAPRTPTNRDRTDKEHSRKQRPRPHPRTPTHRRVWENKRQTTEEKHSYWEKHGAGLRTGQSQRLLGEWLMLRSGSSHKPKYLTRTSVTGCCCGCGFVCLGLSDEWRISVWPRVHQGAVCASSPDRPKTKGRCSLRHLRQNLKLSALKA